MQTKLNWIRALRVALVLGMGPIWANGQDLSTSAETVVALRGASFAALDAKARSGEPLRVLCLGGSITQNDSGHSSRVPAWLQARYPDSDVDRINAGLSSTGSNTGAFRLGGLLESHAPLDLLVVEYAVNDDQDAAHGFERAVRGMEGIVLKAREEGIATLMVLYINPHLLESIQEKNPATSIRAHLAVADRHGVPTVNLNAALAEAIEAGTFDWEQYGGVHPGDAGYGFAVGHITDALERLLSAGEGAPMKRDSAPLDAASYANAHWVSPAKAVYGDAWKLGHPSREMMPVGAIRKEYSEDPLLRGEEPGAELTFAFEGNAVSAFVLAGPDAGMVEVTVDNRPTETMDLYHRHSAGLNYPRTMVFADGLESGSHQLRLKIAERKNSESQGHAVNILYFGVNQNAE